MRRLLLTLMLVLGFSAPVMAENFTKEQIETMIHDYIMKNPKVLIDSVNEYGRAQQMEEENKASANLEQHMDWLVKNPNHPEAGNPKGDVTVVEFFDYNCGYCKHALPDVLTIIEEDKNVRVVFVDIPILGESSTEAAKWALAAQKQGKYLEYHSALMQHKGALDAPTLEDLAKGAGLDVEKLKKDKDDPSIASILTENTDMTGKIGISGTPAFVVGKKLIRGYVGLDGLKQAIAESRAQ